MTKESIKKFFSQNKVSVGLVGALGSELLCAALLWLGLLLAGTPAAAHVRWFAVCIVPPLLMLRFYAKKRRQQTVVKTIISVVFVTFVAFMWLLFNGHHLG